MATLDDLLAKEQTLATAIQAVGAAMATLTAEAQSNAVDQTKIQTISDALDANTVALNQLVITKG